jgi:hypothetical protein
VHGGVCSAATCDGTACAELLRFLCFFENANGDYTSHKV